MKKVVKTIKPYVLIFVLAIFALCLMSTVGIQTPLVGIYVDGNYTQDIVSQKVVINGEHENYSLGNISYEQVVTFDAPDTRLLSIVDNKEINSTENYIVDAPLPDVIPYGTIYPKPANMPDLRHYEINKDRKLWMPQDPQSYIVPADAWAKYIASMLYIAETGEVRYKNSPVPWLVDTDGSVVLWIDKPFFNNYMSSDELFNFPPNGDILQNVDYYLSRGMRGSCKDWAVALTSMMLSGEMSIKENGTYVRQVIPAKVVFGYSGQNRDAWTEYRIYGNVYVSSTGKVLDQDTEKFVSMTTFHPENEWKDKFVPIYQFTNKYFGNYVNDSEKWK
jgi:hypothetical protein